MPESERKFLEDYDPAAFERPSVAVDLVLLSVRKDGLEALVVRRAEHPELGKWALPGGFVGMAESLDDTAKRVLDQKAGVKGVFLEQLYSFGRVDRDPRTRVISNAYYALFDAEKFAATLDNTEDRQLARVTVSWQGEQGGRAQISGRQGGRLSLAFDHGEILGMAVKRLRGKLDYSPVGFELLPKRFTLRQLQEVHEAILGRPLNKPAFRRRMLDKGMLAATGEKEQGVTFRPAELYRFRRPGGT